MARKSRKHITAQAAMPASPFISTALYIRLSVEDNNKRGNSIETQKLVLEKFLLGKPELRLYDIYIDNGATGTNFNRDGFQRMLSDIESGKVGCVIVKDLSRLGRNAIDTGYYIERYFPSHNVRFISVTDQFDSENPDNLHGGIILPLKNMINEAYALDIGRKIKAQARQDMKEGKYVGARAPFGYMKDPDDCHKLIIDPVAAPVVRQIFQWAYEKVPLNRIVLLLNEGNYPSPGKYKMQTGEITHQALAGRGYWQTWTVAKILKEDKYTGDMVQGRTKTVLHRQVPAGEENLIVVTGTHEPIVSKEIFDAVQKYRAEVAEESKKHPVIPYTPNIFKGRIFCGDCGRSLHRQRSHGVYRFHCLTPTRVHKDKCAGVSISETELIATVLDILKRELAVVLGDYSLLLKDNMQKQEKEAASREKINRAKLQLNQSRELLQTLYENLMNGAIDSEEYFDLKATYEKQMQAAQKELSFYENQSAVRQEQAEKCKNLEKDEQELLAGGSLTAALIERLIERITVYPDKQVDVKFTFRTEFEAFKEAAE